MFPNELVTFKTTDKGYSQYKDKDKDKDKDGATIKGVYQLCNSMEQQISFYYAVKLMNL